MLDRWMVLHDLRYTTAHRPFGCGQTRDDGVDRINGSLDRRPQDRDAHRCPTDQHDREKAQRTAIGGHDTRSLALSVGKWCAVFSHQIGRASWRARVCQYVYISVVAGHVKKKKKPNK